MAIVNEEKTSSATIWYLERSDLYKVEKPYQTTFDTAALGGPTDNLRFVDAEISVQDAQDDRERFSIDTHGFQFCRWPTSLSLHEFGSEESLRSSYYLEIKQYVQQIRSGAAHIQVMSHTRRNSSSYGYESSGISPPVRYAHADYSPRGGAIVLEKIFKEHPELRGRRYEFLNVWRVTKGPNRTWPLAVCDYQSICISSDVDFADVIHRDSAGEQLLFYRNPSHRWYFLDNQGVEDVIVFRHTDSRGIQIPFGAHVSFQGQSLDGVRQSIEVRLVCFY